MAANLLGAGLSGLLGAVVMAVFIYLFKAIGFSLDIPYLLGTRFVSIENRSNVYFTGITLHLLLGGIWGIIYVYFLIAMAVTPNWPAGILYGFAHGIFIGVMISILSANHPYIGENKPIKEPGMFGSEWGTAIPYILLVIHVIFGVTTLLAYNRLFHG